MSSRVADLSSPPPSRGARAGRVANAFTVDVEDYYHVSAFSAYVRPEHWDAYESRVVRNTHRILRLLADHGTRGTFFVLGWVAHKFPSLVRDIRRDGHELASHGYWHRLIYDQSPEEFRADLRRSRDAIEEAAGVTVTAYRAPSFSVTNRSLWALDVLIEEGFTFDSSVFPVRHDRYGIPGSPRFPHRIDRPAGGLLEFPPSVYRAGPVNVPVAGGGYFRLLPLGATVHAIRRMNASDRQPFMFYIHPWEVDPDQPRIAASLRSRFRHYQGLRRTEAKLAGLLKGAAFGAASDCVAAANSESDAKASQESGW